MPDFPEASIHSSLSNLTRQGIIRRVLHGLYDYPRFSDTLGEILSPAPDQVAQALARKFNWRIQPSGEAALNLLGLSTQVPGRWVYLSDGPSREYVLGRQVIAFRKAPLKEVGFRFADSGLLVHALKALGKEHIDEDVIATLRRRYDAQTCTRLIRDTAKVTVWVSDAIKRICQGGQ